MTSLTVEERLRRFLLGVAVFIFVGTILELWFEEHTEGWIQLIPFGLSILGALVAGVALYVPGRGVLQSLRALMVVIALGSAFGLYEHLEHNIAFELEIRPGAGIGDVFWEALFGASPLLAPGILALGAILALAATYQHPALD